MSPRSLGKFVAALYIGALTLYMLAGVTLAPFHGDESTIIEMSRDWYRLVVDHNLAAILYNPTPPDTAFQGDQDLRLLNGVLSKYGIGLAASVSGIAANDLPTRWLWGQDWYVNQYYGHIPVNPLLFIARMSSVLMAMVSIALAYRIGAVLSRPRVAALIAFIYATLPAVLLNGRRAMFEGAFLLATALLIFTALQLARHMQTDNRLRRWAFFAAALGLAPAAKHTAALPAIPILLVLLWLGRKHLLQTLRRMAISLVVAVLIFFPPSPAGWSPPLQMPGVVLKVPDELLGEQVGLFDTYQNTTDRVLALINYPFGRPQYFEEHFNGSQGSQDWLPDPITAYEQSQLVGIDWSQLGAVAWILIATGITVMIKQALVAKRND